MAESYQYSVQQTATVQIVNKIYSETRIRDRETYFLSIGIHVLALKAVYVCLASSGEARWREERHLHSVSD